MTKHAGRMRPACHPDWHSGSDESASGEGKMMEFSFNQSEACFQIRFESGTIVRAYENGVVRVTTIVDGVQDWGKIKIPVGFFSSPREVAAGVVSMLMSYDRSSPWCFIDDFPPEFQDLLRYAEEVGSYVR